MYPGPVSQGNHAELLTQIEAIPTLIMASTILFLLPSFPFTASFLTPREKAIAQARVNRDHRPQSHGGMSGWEGFKAVVNDFNAWALMVIYASCGYILLWQGLALTRRITSQRRRRDDLVLPANCTCYCTRI